MKQNYVLEFAGREAISDPLTSLLKLNARGMNGPELAVDDGAMGFGFPIGDYVFADRMGAETRVNVFAWSAKARRLYEGFELK
jgi:hypothetical protein